MHSICHGNFGAVFWRILLGLVLILNGGRGVPLGASDLEATGLPPFPDIERFEVYIGGGIQTAYFAAGTLFDPGAIIHDAVENLERTGATASSQFFGGSLMVMPLYFFTDWFAIGGELRLERPSHTLETTLFRFPIHAAIHFNIADIVQITPLIGMTLMVNDGIIGTAALFDVGVRVDFWKHVNIHIHYLLGKVNGVLIGIGGGFSLF